ncbi:hypothetical protein Goshw_030383 [Gossypium schwendimanii]|uniref:Uncharacterized protein n=1 Tax=Gossypium schwendimanii TaxID=34291 RepID=A0A7J9M8J6_GOSSC|nr:hypothetical protein [Gossypium schwendimanii]
MVTGCACIQMDPFKMMEVFLRQGE